MKTRLFYAILVIALVIALAAAAFQSFFNPGPIKPDSVSQKVIFWAVLSLIFLLIVTLSWILFREAVKLYVERQSQREGSRIKTKLVLGALTLSVVPICFLFGFNYILVNRNMIDLFREPRSQELNTFISLVGALNHEMADEVNAQAALLAAQPEIRQFLEGAALPPDFLGKFCRQYELSSAAVLAAPSRIPLASWGAYGVRDGDGRTVEGNSPVLDGRRTAGFVTVSAIIPADVASEKREVSTWRRDWEQLRQAWRDVRKSYILLMILITVFVLFVAVWIAIFLAKQISVPITALLSAVGEVRRGNLSHRVEAPAADELGDLVRGFNRMIEDLDATSRELDRRRRFTEAILESIPTGVISISADGAIKRINRALSQIFPAEQAASAARLEDLFSREDTAEIKYLMKRARRTGAASRQFELRAGNRKLHLAVTVSALEEKLTSGFVVVLEDTSELLRAQKAAAWHEVARRVAHEIKNPLTPIALSAERIARQLDRVDLPPATARIVAECAAAISNSVESVRTLVDEFSQFARFPSAQPVRSNLNEVVAAALAIFHGRLEGITIRTSFAEGLPPVNIDPEQFRRVVVNLVDNAAEAMQDSLMKDLYIATQPGAAETVELVIADTGCGVDPEEKEKLFLPYFSTKNRGTGLGLAIVSHILAEHNAQIRVEDNQPVGARFTVEIPAITDAEPAEAALRSVALKV